MAGGDVARPLFFETRRDLTTEIGRERTSSGKDAAFDPRLEARHLARDFGKASRRTGQRRT
jgi:hypothetical protein